MNDTPITVVAVDDHPLIREAIHSLLASRNDMQLVGEGWVGEHVFQLVEKHRPDVLILDVGMPDSETSQADERFSALPTVEKLNSAYPDTAVIFLTQYAYQSLSQGAMALGVRGYLLKSDNLSLKLPGAIEAVHRGGAYFSKEVSQLLFQSSKGLNSKPVLSNRQKEIVLAIAQNPDASYQQIANELSITESTVKGHLNKVFKALEVANITACILACMQQRLIPFTIDELGCINFGSLEEVA